MDPKFKKGDLVIVKLRLNPAWPAEVVSVEPKARSHVFNVNYLGSNDTGKCRPSEIYDFQDNKQKLLYSKNNLSEPLRLAIKEAEELIKVKNTPKKLVIGTSTPGKSSQLTPPSSSVTNSLVNVYTDYTPQMNTNNKLPTRDKAINTTPDIDLTVQLNAVTDRCIELEKSLIAKNSKETGTSKELSIGVENQDFQTRILVQELKTAQTEITSYKKTIELLQQDIVKLGSELDEIKSRDNSCMHCFPSISPCQSNKNYWQAAKGNKSVRNQKSESINNLECSNRFSHLDVDSAALETSPMVQKPKKTNTKHVMQRTRPQNYFKKLGEPDENNKLVIVADSHGHNLSHLVQQRTTSSVMAFVRPAADFYAVTRDVESLTKNMTLNDHMLLIAGTNSIGKTSVKRLTDDMFKIAEDLDHTNLIIATLPMRHDQPNLDLKISCINAQIERFAVESKKFRILPLHELPRHLFTNHGLHLNKRGKAKVAEKIAQLILPNKSVTSEPSSIRCSTPLPSSSSETQRIHVIEADIRYIFEQYKNDTSVAFAHTISADFDHCRHMSAGVAVAFRERFDRPQPSDCIHRTLACQKVENGPIVYSLITKPVYSGKPTKTEYNLAFQQLLQDFKLKGLKTLICSAMGCVRDLIQPQHFIHNILQFQQESGATVKIISYDQKAKRKLWNGLTHGAFVEILRTLIVSCQQQTVLQETKEHNQPSAVISSPNCSLPTLSVSSPPPQSEVSENGQFSAYSEGNSCDVVEAECTNVSLSTPNGSKDVNKDDKAVSNFLYVTNHCATEP